MRVVSYNLRFASENDPQPWSRRRKPMITLLTELGPDVLGTEEGLDHQLADLDAGLPASYRRVSEHRHHDDGSENAQEYSAIFYNSETVDLIDVSHAWLSDTPEVPGSRTWGTHFPRMFSTVRFRRLADGRTFTVITTHVDHEVATAQLKSAQLLRQRAEAVDHAEPLLVMGDFNVGEGSEPYAILTCGGLRDAYLTAAERGPRLGTFNNYRPPDPAGERIDWILVSDHVRVLSARILDTAPGGQYPSDHLPVEAVVDF
ncbi:endonuclease/exonuclease/phosphatase family protein [Microlunatus elymi]|uniref:Endonuclease/exonuclease/phosphatase family protein n=1 Tax=Microlunatus elymi TaxID=2596828 RepID=A0A516Q0S8_9ACTN|nr:endonuclease/exonuclease/phosphatase family protein [Microlunatus elymi]QDP97043.1 endonuclease/exonuclease/phosphatase family protein [Microlunatus elymi]